MNLADSLLQILNMARAIGGAACGAVFVYNPGVGCLQMLAQHGFSDAMKQRFRFLSPNDFSASARAFRLGKRVLIPDVGQDPFYLPYLPLARLEGYVAVQSTPIVDAHRQSLGVLTTNFPAVSHLSRAETEVLDKYAARAACFVQTFWVYELCDGRYA